MDEQSVVSAEDRQHLPSSTVALLEEMEQDGSLTEFSLDRPDKDWKGARLTLRNRIHISLSRTGLAWFVWAYNEGKRNA